MGAVLTFHRYVGGDQWGGSMAYNGIHLDVTDDEEPYFGDYLFRALARGQQLRCKGAKVHQVRGVCAFTDICPEIFSEECVVPLQSPSTTLHLATTKLRKVVAGSYGSYHHW